MNPRKRAAEEPLLPTRSVKQPRQTRLRADGQPASPTQSEGILGRWVRLGKEALALLRDTLSEISPLGQDSSEQSSSSSSMQSSASDPVPRLLSPPRRVTKPLPPPPPTSRTSSLLVHRNSIRNSPLRLSQLTVSSPLATKFGTVPMAIPPNRMRKELPLLPASSIASTSSIAGPSSQAFPSTSTTASPAPRRPVKPFPTRPHIFAAQHKRQVEEDRSRIRNEMLEELYTRSRKSGFKSTKADFLDLLNYRARLQGDSWSRPDTPSLPIASSSLIDLSQTLKSASLDERTRRHSLHGQFPEASNDFIRKALEMARKTAKAPPLPPPFTPGLDLLQVRTRSKDAEIERRLRARKRVPLPASLPPQDEAAVNALLKRNGVVAKYEREQVSGSDLQRLRPGQWLNDEIINFYGAMILGRSADGKENATKVNGVNGQVNGKAGKKKEQPQLLSVHYFSSFFWQKLVADGYQKGRLSKWTKKIDLFSKDVVLIPVNHSNTHWTAAAINFRKKRFEAYDSMSIKASYVFRNLRAYLDAEHQSKKGKPFDFTGWTDYVNPDTPQQENGYDCGVFTCQFLESLSRGEDDFNFTQENIPFLRRKMIWEIGNTRFWEPESS